MLTNINSLMEGFSFLNIDRRNDIRHSISCNALLNARFSGFKSSLKAKMTNISGTGALVYTDHVYVGRHHLISVDSPPKINIKIKLPDESFELPIEIRWYKWSVEKNCFEIGIHFILMFKETRIAVNRLISKLKNRTARMMN